MNLNSRNLGIVISSLVVGSVLLVCALKLKIAPNYSEFVVGSIAWDARAKIQDLIAWPAFISITFFGFTALSKIASSLAKSYGDSIAGRFIGQLVLWSLPFYASAGTLLLGGTIDNRMALISALGIFSLGLIAFTLEKKGVKKVDPEYWSIVLLLALLISLVPIEIAVLLSRMPSTSWINLNLRSFTAISDLFILFGFALSVIALSRHDKKPSKNLPKLIFAAQIGLPLFFLALYPAKILQPSGELTQYKTTIYLKILLVVILVGAMYDVIRRFRANLDQPDWRGCLSPIALFGVVVALRIGSTVTPHISVDDYHFGEYLLGWWSYVKGFVPYVDYIPAHGILEDDFGSFLSYIFYDGTAASLGEASRLAFAFLGAFAFISLYYFSGSLILAFAVVLLLGGRLTWFFFVPFICLWLNDRLKTQPSKWLSIWILTVPVVILGAPPQGLLLVIAFGFLAVKITWDQIRLGDIRSWQYLCFVVVFTSLLFAATPLLSMMLGAIRYVFENGSINQVAYGIPWVPGWNEEQKSGFVFESIRMSWVAIPILCLFVIRKYWRDFKDCRSFFYPALIFFIFSLLLIPYSMGRIDPGDVSRPGLVSVFGWTILFPIIVWRIYRSNARSFVVLISVFMGSLLGFGVTSFSGLSSVAAQKVQSAPLRDSDMAGLPNIGRASVEDDQWERINRLNRLLTLRLAAGETYLDLTSRNANYFYMNRLPPIAVTAPYNLVSSSQQKRAIDALGVSPPKLALLQAENIVQDGGGLALRNPLLYKFVLDNYVPRMESGFIVGYLKPELNGDRENTITAEIGGVADENWAPYIGSKDASLVLSDPILVSMLKVGDRIHFAGGESRVIDQVWPGGAAIWLDRGVSAPNIPFANFIDIVVSPKTYQEYTASLFHRSFAISDLKKIPVSWGKSERSLRDEMMLPIGFGELSSTIFQLSLSDGSYKIEGDEPKLTFDVSSLGVSGRSSGLLKFDFNCVDKTSDPRVQIFWWGDERNGPFDDSSIRFTAENGTMIVPLDASPWWVGLHQIKGLSFVLDNATACTSFNVKNIFLYQRK